ncbi:MAG: hypothetical protein R3C09_06640 [Pirellulaceae bacterium]
MSKVARAAFILPFSTSALVSNVIHGSTLVSNMAFGSTLVSNVVFGGRPPSYFRSRWETTELLSFTVETTELLC